MPDRLALDEIYPWLDQAYKRDDPDVVRKVLRRAATECGLGNTVSRLANSLGLQCGEVAALKILAALGLWLEEQEAK